jgi:hypothetical protein
MLLINMLSIYINLSNKDIVVYIPLSTGNFFFINTSSQELAPTKPPTQSGWDVENDDHRFLLRLKKERI